MTYDRRMFDEQGYRSSRNIRCLQWQHLVYVRTLKCASEFFWSNLQHVGWQEIAWADIKWEYNQWQHNHVFSFIMDPIKRRHKGMAEWVIHNGCQHELLTDAKFQLLINAAPSLDEHSASLEDLYGDRMDYIEWLPVTKDHAVAIRSAEQLLATHNHPPITWIQQANLSDGTYVDYVHETKDYMENLYQTIKNLWDTNHVGDSNHYYFKKDVQTWRQVCSRYNIAWIEHTGA